MKPVRNLPAVLCVLTTFAALPRAGGAAEVRVESPDGALQAALRVGRERLELAIDRAGQPVLAPSAVGLVVDGVDLGQGAGLGEPERFEADESYATRGVHSRARNHYRGVRIPIRHPGSSTSYTVELRVFDDGVALRQVVPGGERERVVDEASRFRLVPGSTVWYHGLRGHYEGMHEPKAIADVKAGEWAAPPLTFRLPEGRGYGSITEAALLRFSGLALEADGQLGFAARLGHAQPPSYPYTLRYGDDEAKRLSHPAAIAGTITTPWRVVMVGPDLNTLVNCDIETSLSAPPDPKLFPEGLATSWIRPGRAVWMYLDGGSKTIDGVKEFSRLAGALGFEHQIVEGFWSRWSSDELRDVVAYSKEQGVGIWLWKHSRDLRTPEARERFFRLCQDAGAAGAKIDFFDHEAKEVVELYEACLRGAAAHHLMIDFHGANKPTGESRTFPNEMTREAIAGLEGSRRPSWAAHNTTWPFTRLLAGPADYTPMHFGSRRKDTTWTHQIATAAVLTSPVLVYAANPRAILDNPAVDLIKSIPSVWDETIVLPVSEIGERAALARRSGDRWFLAIVNGPEAATVRVPLAFLGSGVRHALVVRDRPDDPAALTLDESRVKPDDALTIPLQPGGGFIARFDRP
jgi:alpha-glucosidase